MLAGGVEHALSMLLVAVSPRAGSIVRECAAHVTNSVLPLPFNADFWDEMVLPDHTPLTLLALTLRHDACRVELSSLWPRVACVADLECELGICGRLQVVGVLTARLHRKHHHASTWLSHIAGHLLEWTWRLASWIAHPGAVDVDQPDSAYISTLAVLPSARRQGVATALIECAATYYHTQIREDIMSLHVLETNAMAQALYARNAFVVEGTVPEYYFIDGVEHDGVLLCRDFRTHPALSLHALGEKYRILWPQVDDSFEASSAHVRECASMTTGMAHTLHAPEGQVSGDGDVLTTRASV